MIKRIKEYFNWENRLLRMLNLFFGSFKEISEIYLMITEEKDFLNAIKKMFLLQGRQQDFLKLIRFRKKFIKGVYGNEM